MRLRFTWLLIVAALFALLPISVAGPTVLTAQAPGAIPRTPDGKPDLTGYCQVMNTANFDIQDHQAREGVPAGC